MARPDLHLPPRFVAWLAPFLMAFSRRTRSTTAALVTGAVQAGRKHGRNCTYRQIPSETSCIKGAVQTGDGGYDQDRVYAGVAERHPDAAVIVPPRVTAVPSDTALTAPTQRDRHLQHIAEHGRMAWQKASGYTMRARAEAAMARWKQVIGDGLRLRTAYRRATEVDVAVHALNRMWELGRLGRQRRHNHALFPKRPGAKPCRR